MSFASRNLESRAVVFGRSLSFFYLVVRDLGQKEHSATLRIIFCPKSLNKKRKEKERRAALFFIHFFLRSSSVFCKSLKEDRCARRRTRNERKELREASMSSGGQGQHLFLTLFFPVPVFVAQRGKREREAQKKMLGPPER